jgi:hypothetical protein
VRRQSECPAWRRRSSPESSDKVTGDSQSPERGERLGLGRASERGRPPTGPGWSGLTR